MNCIFTIINGNSPVRELSRFEPQGIFDLKGLYADKQCRITCYS